MYSKYYLPIFYILPLYIIDTLYYYLSIYEDLPKSITKTAED